MGIDIRYMNGNNRRSEMTTDLLQRLEPLDLAPGTDCNNTDRVPRDAGGNQ
jgi:hypothetical protein